MIGVSLVLFVVSIDGNLGLIDGALLTAGIVAYTVWAIVSSRRANKALVAEYAEEFGETETTSGGLVLDMLMVAGGPVVLVLGSELLVTGARGIGGSLEEARGGKEGVR